MDKERNTRLLEEYQKLSYEELEKMENDLNISYNDYVIVGLARALKAHEEGRKGIPIEEAFEEIKSESGTHFDPKLVEVFLESKDKLIKSSGQTK